jgi:membrane-associated phospholipid phosphatase
METGSLHFAETRRREWPFFAVMVIFWVLLGVLLATEGYTGAFAWVNGFQNAPLNWVSLHFFTHLGDGLILPALVILFFWRRDPAFVISFVVAVFFTAVVTQLGKRVFFEDWMRPASVFSGVPGITIYDPNPPMEHSFPSGHATSSAAGGVFFAWAMYAYQKWLPWLVGLLTGFLCLTRVLVGAHFPGDILVGSMIGSLGALAVLILVYPRVHNRLHGMQRLSHPTLGYVAMGFAALLIVGQFARLLLAH